MAKRRYDSNKAKRSLGLKIRSLREERGWTLESCEEHGPINWRQLQRIESGHNVTLKTLIVLANLFGVHPTVLLEDI
jgi:transcriptional regulator with XRE-family HTH domain